MNYVLCNVGEESFMGSMPQDYILSVINLVKHNLTNIKWLRG